MKQQQNLAAAEGNLEVKKRISILASISVSS
jgi:hypothetical protein